MVCEWLAWVLRMKRPGRDLSRQFLLRKARMRELEEKNPPSLSLISNVKDVDNAIPLNDFPPLRSMRMDDGGYHSVRNELLGILNELRFITHKIKEDAEAEDETNDWKFAAMVIDRLCFWIFTVWLTVGTLAIFFSAPNMFKSWIVYYVSLFPYQNTPYLTFYPNYNCKPVHSALQVSLIFFPICNFPIS